MFSKTKFKEWFDRYKYAELLATSTVIACSQLNHFFDAVSTAYFITFAEYIAFYGVIFTISYLQLIKKAKAKQQKVIIADVAVLVKNLLLEFGYPAVLDLLFFRPFCMYWLPIITGNAVIGIITGKLCADVIFYFLTIVNYELLQRANKSK